MSARAVPSASSKCKVAKNKNIQGQKDGKGFFDLYGNTFVVYLEEYVSL
jgi:hypothetical protein